MGLPGGVGVVVLLVVVGYVSLYRGVVVLWCVLCRRVVMRRSVCFLHIFTHILLYSWGLLYWDEVYWVQFEVCSVDSWTWWAGVAGLCVLEAVVLVRVAAGV